MQQPASTQAMTPNPPTADVAAVHTASVTVYHSANHVSLTDTEENVDVLAGAKCVTCGRVMPPGVLTSPANPPLVSQSQSIAGPTPSSSRRTNTHPAVSSNLRLAPLTAPSSPLGVPLPTRPAPPPPVPISDNIAHANTTNSEGAPKLLHCQSRHHPLRFSLAMCDLHQCWRLRPALPPTRIWHRPKQPLLEALEGVVALGVRGREAAEVHVAEVEVVLRRLLLLLSLYPLVRCLLHLRLLRIQQQLLQ